MLSGMAANRSMRVVMSYVMHPYRPRLTLRDWRGLAGYSAWTWLLSLAVLVRDRCDSLLIGRLMQSSAVGFYSVGAEIAALPTTELIEPLGRAAFSGFAAGRREQADLAGTYLRLIGFTALLVMPAGVGLSLVARPLVALAFGSGWEQAIPVLRILAIASTLLVLGHLSQHLLSAYALLGRLTGITLVAAGLRIALLAALIPSWGLAGAAYAAALSIVFEQAAIIAVTMRRLRISVRRLAAHVWRPLFSATVMTAALTALGLGWSSSANLIATAGFGAVLYSAGLGATWVASGRPPGAEADVLATGRRLLRRQSPLR
jgi:O-antigen/teichoic acid export membrane protein